MMAHQFYSGLGTHFMGCLHVAEQLSLAHLWPKHASTTKRSFSALSTTEESGRASSSRPRAKREINVLSAAIVLD
ncbi:hypothetical protein GmHk_02G004511 [Glycine max]|nr:hypothetical protein GmHk_02G004511 [Glycine max]